MIRFVLLTLLFTVAGVIFTFIASFFTGLIVPGAFDDIIITILFFLLYFCLGVTIGIAAIKHIMRLRGSLMAEMVVSFAWTFCGAILINQIGLTEHLPWWLVAGLFLFIAAALAFGVMVKTADEVTVERTSSPSNNS